jgi:hypothetical protein
MSVPSYAQLPQLAGLGMRHSRGLLPPTLGTLSFLSDAATADAAAGVTAGRTVPLNLAVDAFRPPLFGRSPLHHRALEVSRNDAEDVIDAFNPQASSQLDGLAHVRAREAGYYDGSTDLDHAREGLGMHHWARVGIAGRGVLLDAMGDAVQRGLAWSPFDGVALTATDLADLAARQRVELRRGDILLIRTGWAATYLAVPPAERPATSSWNGLSAAEETAAFLWDTGIALVGSDNPAVENAPGSAAVGSLHRRLLPALGMPLMELLDLEELADRCAEKARWDFLFLAVPMHLVGGVSSPANAIALL